MNGEHETTSVVFWSLLAVGGALTIYGLHGLLNALGGITGHQFLEWFVGADIAHDALVAPAACVVGFAIARLVPAPARAHVRAGIFASAIVVAIAWAPLHAYGHANAAGNSSVEPLNYATAVPTVLVAVWALTAGWFAVTAFRRRNQSRGAEQPAPRPDQRA
jgi:hypothetical protein